MKSLPYCCKTRNVRDTDDVNTPTAAKRQKRASEKDISFHPSTDTEGLKGFSAEGAQSQSSARVADRNIASVDVNHDKGVLTDIPFTSRDPRFFAASQMLVHRFHHQPLPGERCKSGEIPRPVHGAVHLCRAAMWIPVLFSLRCELKDPEVLAFPREYLPFVMLTAMLHDAGRKGEGKDLPEWEKASAEHCESHLFALGCPPEFAARCKRAIMNKDGCLSKDRDLVTRLLHDADCMEILRMPEGSLFNMGRLDLFKDFQSLKGINQKLYDVCVEVRSTIARQGDLWGDTRICNEATGFEEVANNALKSRYSDTLKERYEFADNVLGNLVSDLEASSPRLFALYRQSAGAPPAIPTLSPLTMQWISGRKGWSANTGFAGVYRDNKTRKVYYVKEPKNPESARNEVLMAQLARVLGLNVPDIQLVREKGRSFVVSPWQDDLRVFSGEGCNPSQLARLYLVASVLGNINITGENYDNLFTPRQ